MLRRLSLLLLLSLSLAGCKYDEPGQEGQLPAPAPDWGVTVVSDDIAPDAEAIPCGEVRSIHLSLNQTVGNCTGYNFNSLYQRAKVLVDARIGQITCPAGCTIRQAYYTHWSWSCTGTKAKVEVKAKLRCLEAEEPLPPNAGDGSTMNFTAAAVTNATGESGAVAPPLPAPPAAPPLPRPTAKGEVMVIDANAPLWAPLVMCGQKHLLSVTYRRRTGTGGPPPFGYESYVDEATARARLLHASFVCQGPCVKRRFRPLFTSWGLSGADVVTVRVVFEVDCPN